MLTTALPTLPTVCAAGCDWPTVDDAVRAGAVDVVLADPVHDLEIVGAAVTLRSAPGTTGSVRVRDGARVTLTGPWSALFGGPGLECADSDVSLDQATVDGNGIDRGMEATNCTVRLTSSTVEGGVALGPGGGGWFKASTVVSVDSRWTNNTSNGLFQGGGGAIAAEDGSTLTVVGGALDANAAEGPGGAISVSEGGLVVTDVDPETGTAWGPTQFTTNTSTYAGGAIELQSAFAELTAATFHDHDASLVGGAIHARFSTIVGVDLSLTDGGAVVGGLVALEDCAGTLRGSSFSRGSAAGQGGALSATWTSYGELRLDGCDFADNDAALGGAVALVGGEVPPWVSVRGGSMSGNTAGQGGGAVWAQDLDALWVHGVAFGGSAGPNRSSADGGAIAVADSGSAHLAGVTVEGDRADDDGGALWASGVDVVTVRGSAFVDTSADRGGGLWISGARRAVVSSVDFARVTARVNGGAVALSDVGQTDVRWTTFCDATAAEDGGAVWANASDVDVHHGWAVGASAGRGAVLHAEAGTSSALAQLTVSDAVADEGSVAFVANSAELDIDGILVSALEGTTLVSNGPVHLGRVATDPNSEVSYDGDAPSGPEESVVDPIEWLAGASEPVACGRELRIAPDSPQSPGAAARDYGAFGTDDTRPAWKADTDGDGLEWRYDCAPDDGAVGEGFAERCDGVDNDCDGTIDEEIAYVVVVTDADGDGWAAPGDPVTTCDPAPDQVAADSVSGATDCDDADPTVHRCPGPVTLFGGACGQAPGGGLLGATLALAFARRRARVHPARSGTST